MGEREIFMTGQCWHCRQYPCVCTPEEKEKRAKKSKKWGKQIPVSREAFELLRVDKGPMAWSRYLLNLRHEAKIARRTQALEMVEINRRLEKVEEIVEKLNLL